MHGNSPLAQHENSSCPLVIAKHTGQCYCYLWRKWKLLLLEDLYTPNSHFFLMLLYYYAKKKHQAYSVALNTNFKYELRHSPIFLIPGWNADKMTEIIQCCFQILAIASANNMNEDWNFLFLNNIKVMIILKSTNGGCWGHSPSPCPVSDMN